MKGDRPRLRHQLSKDAVLGEQFRDTQKVFDATPVVVLRRVEMAYTEPLTLGNLDRSPEGIEVMRVIDMSAQETPVQAGGLCHFTWRPALGGAQIMSIDGMNLAASGGKKFRFMFRLTFAPTGGANG